jgi:hypothetical protein
MATAYVIIKAAKEITGEFVLVQTEKAFKNKELAQQYLRGQNIVWEETINGAECQCERAVHEVELID